MKTLFRFALAGVVCCFQLTTALSYARELPDRLEHLDLEMTGSELQSILTASQAEGSVILSPNDPLVALLGVGKRNLEWIQAINSVRPEDRKLVLSSAETQVGYPIDQATESNRKIIVQNRDALFAVLPMKVKEVLLGSGELPKQPPIEDSAFIDYARKVDRLYSQASRWLLQEPYLWEYESIAWRDVRGYYFLHKELQLEKELRAFASLDAPTRDRLKGLLVILCTNSQESRQSCKQGLEAAIQKRAVYDFFNHYDRDGSDLWSSYFKIQNARSDANFSKANPDLFLLPFVQPETQEIAAFLSDNIQDEWRFGPWKLNLAFQSGSSEMAHVVFVPGATPHVNGLGGSEITMDANRPLTDYTARWTIRHEFGHVLGFPDCYTEFYDSEKQAMVQYQLDITNLMCSRRGHLQEQHVEELKRAYF